MGKDSIANQSVLILDTYQTLRSQYEPVLKSVAVAFEFLSGDLFGLPVSCWNSWVRPEMSSICFNGNVIERFIMQLIYRISNLIERHARYWFRFEAS